MDTHILKSGAVVLVLSNHGFKFSDGTECGGQDPELVKAFTLKRTFEARPAIAGMKVNSMKMALSEEQVSLLKEVCEKVSIVIVPFPMLTALREQGVRAEFPNVVAFNATAETQRVAPQDKVVDINNWSY